MPRKGTTKITPTELDKMVDMYLQTSSYAEVGRAFNRAQSTTQLAVERYILHNPEQYKRKQEYYIRKKEDEFIKNTTNIIGKITEKIADEIDNEEKNYNITQLTTTMGILYDKRQLSMGKSTSNNAVVIKMDASLKELAK